MEFIKIEWSENELYFDWLKDNSLRNRLTTLVKDLEISLTKIKEIEKGTCKYFNAINSYINYFGNSLI